VDRFHPRFRRPPARITALYVGRVSIEKDLDLLVRLFRQRRDVDLVIAGDGPYRNELRRLLPRAILPGFLAGEELSQAYASADVFLFPSKTDTFGNAVLEAMSSGVPAIVTDQMGPKELIRHGEDGFVASNEWEFRRCLEALIDRPSLRQAMGQSARKSALSRSWSAVFAQLFQQYLLSSHLR
jgi:glycosyltransferase involved in cell wall biosynthesis